MPVSAEALGIVGLGQALPMRDETWARCDCLISCSRCRLSVQYLQPDRPGSAVAAHPPGAHEGFRYDG
jgi:hypothetical protein